jgi:hypothetical protein
MGRLWSFGDRRQRLPRADEAVPRFGSNRVPRQLPAPQRHSKRFFSEGVIRSSIESR